MINDQSVPQKLPARISNFLDVLAGIVNRNKSGSEDQSKEEPPKSDLKSK